MVVHESTQECESGLISGWSLDTPFPDSTPFEAQYNTPCKVIELDIVQYRQQYTSVLGCECYLRDRLQQVLRENNTPRVLLASGNLSDEPLEQFPHSGLGTVEHKKEYLCGLRPMSTILGNQFFVYRSNANYQDLQTLSIHR